MRYFVLVAVMMMAGCACDSPKHLNQPAGASAPLNGAPAPEPAADTLPALEGTWALRSMVNGDTTWNRTPQIRFNTSEKIFTGNNGCNSISGSFSLNGDSLRFAREILSTKMACPGYNEQPFTHALLAVRRYSLENGILVLHGSDGALLWFLKLQEP